MIEPLSALSLASSVITFIDLGHKLVTGSLELYRSADGTLSWHAELEYALRTFTDLTTQLSAPSNLPLQLSAEEQTLKEVTVQCHALADEFTSLLQRLKSKGKTGTRKKWSSLWQALNSLLKERQIQDYNRRLSDLRSQLLTCMTAVLGSRQTTLVCNLDKVSKESREHQLESHNTIEKLRTELMDGMKDINRQDDIQTSALRDIQAKLCKLLETGIRERKQNSVLSSLHFENINRRLTTITDAHDHTFEWIFSETPPEGQPQVYFTEWLRSKDNIFWVTGKAGSGKSTLMKYLYENPKTSRYLRQWAVNSELVTAGFFFWISGGELQKSQEGLLRSLLYTILRKAPHLISTICDSKNEEDFIFSDHWSRLNLLTTFDRLSQHAKSLDVHLCLFIDGLDEYGGDHVDIIQVMRKIASIPNIKICLSSRPWNIFVKAFGSNPRRYLQLHELTRKDIKLYVEDIFHRNPEVSQALGAEGDFHDFTCEIVQRAQGVFLWVFLVVRSLLRGAQEGDDLDDFQRRLREIPTDLEAYFRQMLDSVEKIYHTEAARILRICLKGTQSRCLWDPNSVMTVSYFRLAGGSMHKFPAGPFSWAEARQRIEITKLRINARCRDLLEFWGDDRFQNQKDHNFWWFEPKVQFLHRTVRDFLKTEEMQGLLAARDPVAFSKDKFLIHAYLAQTRSAVHLQDFCLLTALLKFIFYQIKATRSLSHAKVLALLDEIEGIVPPLEAWRLAEQTLDKLYFRGSESIPWVLIYALKFDIHQYVKDRIGRESSIRRAIALCVSLYNCNPYEATMNELFRAGATPNDDINGVTPWLYCLYCCMQDPEVWIQMPRIFIENGADTSVQVPPSWFDKVGPPQEDQGYTARDFILKVFAFDQKRTAQMVDLMDQQRAIKYDAAND